MANHFKSLFNIVRENESVAELPVVLEVSLNTTDSTATPTEGETTPSVTPDPVATENEGAGAVVTDVDETVTDNQGTVGTVETDEISEQIIATEDEVAMAEQVIENDSVSDEITNAVEVNDDMQEQVAAQEEVLENPETVTPATVAVATEAFMACVKRLDRNFKRSDFTSLQQISVESFISKENNGQGLNPAMALSIVHEDMKSFGNKVVETIKKLFAMLKEGLAKLWGFISNIFGGYSKTASALIDKLNSHEGTLNDVDVFKIAPVLAKVSAFTVNGLLDYAKHNLEIVKQTIEANNAIGKLKDEGNDAGVLTLTDTYMEIVKLMSNTHGTYLRDKQLIVAYGGTKVLLVNDTPDAQKLEFKVESVESSDKSKVVSIDKNAIINALKPIADNVISKQLQELKKVSNNIGVLEAKFGKFKKVDSSAIQLVQAVLGTLPNCVAKVSVDGAKTVIKIANAALSGNAKKEDKKE